MKRIIYIALAMLLGLMLSTLLHVALEIPALQYLVEGGASAGPEPLLAWEAWKRVHIVITVLVAGGGLVGGWFLGRFWWRIVYMEGRRFRWTRRSTDMPL